MKRAAIYMVLIALCGCVTNAQTIDAAPAGPTTQENTVPLRQIEVTLLGKTSDLKGMKWPDNLDNRWPTSGIDEPCDLIIHLPDGKSLRITTRPVLIIRREENMIVAIHIPPEGAKEKWLPEQAQEMEKIMANWGAIPNEHMRALIDEFKHIPIPKPGDVVPDAGIERVGIARLDNRTELDFELVVGSPGKWNLVAVISAGAQDRERIFREGQARMTAAARAATQPTTQP